MNSGVMYLNATALGLELPSMLTYAVGRRFRFLTLDQSWLAEWFAVGLPASKVRFHEAPRPHDDVPRAAPRATPHATGRTAAGATRRVAGLVGA